MSHSSFAPAHLVESMDRGMEEAERELALMQTAEPTGYTGRRVRLDGAELLNFGCCSYLGLELRPELKGAAIDAIERYGTQFPFPRAMLQCPLYVELGEALGRMTGGHVVVAASTTLAHIAALPVLVGPEDAVVIDVFAHASLHTAVALLRDTTVEVLRHNRLDLLEQKVEELSKRHRRVWFVLDGLYSMRGDLAPLDELAALLARQPALHVYVDDAHSTSWSGTHGRGHALERLRERARVVGVLSLNKAFSAGGGALVFGDARTAERVRRAGGPMVFSGAVQPPLLGAAVASARLHLSAELPVLQERLQERLRLVVELAQRWELPLVDLSLTPVFFLPVGDTQKTFGLVRAMRAKGVCLCAAMFPIVPQQQAGVRFTISLHNELEDVARLVETLAGEARRLS